MIKLDDNLLQEIGLNSLSPDDKKKMLAHIYETLEMRVGMELAKQMSDAQLSEFEQFINRNDEAGALRWLETNFPNYKDVVAAEFDKLKNEIRQVAPQIVASSQQQMQQPMPQQGIAAAPPVPQQYAQPYPPQVPPQPQYTTYTPQQQPQPATPAGYPYPPQQPQYQPQPQPMPVQPPQPQYQPQPYPPQPPQQPPQNNPPQQPSQGDYGLAA